MDNMGNRSNEKMKSDKLNEEIKKCPGCGAILTAKQIMYDPIIRPIGMAYLGDDEDTAFYYFQHEIDGCQSSFVVPVDEFKDFIDEEIHPEKLYGTDQCEQHCVNIADLEACCSECYYAPFRRFLLKMIELKSGCPQTSRAD